MNTQMALLPISEERIMDMMNGTFIEEVNIPGSDVVLKPRDLSILGMNYNYKNRVLYLSVAHEAITQQYAQGMDMLELEPRFQGPGPRAPRNF